MTRRPPVSWPLVFAVGGATLVPLLAAAAIAEATGTNFSFFTRDPLAVAKAPPHLGFVSNLGVMIWTAGAAVLLFGGYRLHTGSRKGRFLVGLGWLSLLLALDDMFMLHDVLQEETALDATVVYAGIAILGVWRYHDVILKETDVVLFTLALGGLAMSAAIDGVLHAVGLSSLPGSAFIEDCFKFGGICMLAAYAALEAARPPVAPPPAVPLGAMPAPVQVTPAAPVRKTPAPL